MNIGSKIQMLRLQNNMTQEDLAEKVGLSRGMIAHIEIGSIKRYDHFYPQRWSREVGGIWNQE